MDISFEVTPLLSSSKEAFNFSVQGSRWWILFWFSYLSALQSLLWFTWSSVPDASKEFLQCDDNTLDLFLNEGPICFCIFIFFGAVALKRRNGLQFSVRLNAIVCITAALIRSIPALMSTEFRDSNHGLVLFLVHLGQIINASVATLTVASPSYISLMWFPEDQRNTATAIANISNALGRAVGFYLGPALVSQTSDLPTLLAVECVIALVPLLCVNLYYPAYPTHPPSTAAFNDLKLVQSNVDLREACITTIKEAKMLIKNKAFFSVMMAGGLEMAVYGAWSGILPSALSTSYSVTQTGTIGSFNTLAGIGGGLVFAFFSDRPRVRPYLIPLIQLLSLLSLIGFVILALNFQPFVWSALSFNFFTVVMLCSFAGFCRGGVDPLYFELSADAANMVAREQHVVTIGSAGTAGSLLTFWYHVVLVIFLSLPADILQKVIPTAQAACMLLSACLLFRVKVAQSRR